MGRKTYYQALFAPLFNAWTVSVHTLLSEDSRNHHWNQSQSINETVFVPGNFVVFITQLNFPDGFERFWDKALWKLDIIQINSLTIDPDNELSFYIFTWKSFLNGVINYGLWSRLTYELRLCSFACHFPIRDHVRSRMHYQNSHRLSQPSITNSSKSSSSTDVETGNLA